MKKFKKIWIITLILTLFTSTLAFAAGEDDNYWVGSVKSDTGYYEIKVSKPHTHSRQYAGDPVDFTKVSHINISCTSVFGLTEKANFHVWKENGCVRIWESKSGWSKKYCASDAESAIKDALSSIQVYVSESLNVFLAIFLAIVASIKTQMRKLFGLA